MRSMCTHAYNTCITGGYTLWIISIWHGVNDNEKYVLLKKHFIPAASYKFPCHSINGQKRSFQHSWLSKYNGLEYSESQDGGYCKFCVLFVKCECSVNEFGVLVERPFTNLKKASEKLSEYFIIKPRKERNFTSML